MSEIHKVTEQTAQTDSKSKWKKIAVIAENIMTAPNRLVDRMFEKACIYFSGIPVETESGKIEERRSKQEVNDYWEIIGAVEKINKIPADMWTRYSRKDRISSVEGMSAPMESTLKVSIEKRKIIERRKDRYADLPGDHFVYHYHLGIRSGTLKILEASGDLVRELFNNINSKVADFEKLDEKEREKIIEKRKNELLNKIKNKNN